MKGETVVTLADLKDLYKVFERCWTFINIYKINDNKKAKKCSMCAIVIKMPITQQ